MIKSVLVIYFTLSLVGCMPTKSRLSVNLKNKDVSAISSASVSSVQVVNHQLIVHGAHLNNVKAVQVNGNSLNENFTIESQTATKIIANSIHNFSFDVSKVFNLILSDANASATFQIDFSLCNATLNGAGFDCSAAVADNDVLTYDLASNTWIPRALSGLSYKGVWNANTAAPSSTQAGEYYIVSVANLPTYSVGDWIVWNGSSYDVVAQSGGGGGVSTVFGRANAVVAVEGDYNLDKLLDVDLTIAPTAGQVLKFDGAKWIADDDVGGGTGSVTTTELADGSVTDVKIAAVAASKITGTITSAQITDATIVNADINAAAAIDYSKLNVPAAAIPLTALNATGTKDGTKYLKGDNTWATLTTDVLGTALTGLTLTNAAITASDTVISAFGKLQKQVTDSAGGTVSGDLSGTLPSPTVAKIRGVTVSATAPADGQFFKYTTTGTNWIPSFVTATDLKSTALGNLFPGSGCAANQTLYYSVVGDSFSCANIDTLDADKITTGTIAAARLPASASYWGAATGGINYAGGKVGIGTASPMMPLHIHSVAGVDPNILLSDADLAHPFSVFNSVIPPTTTGYIGNINGTGGGIGLNGLTSNATTSGVGLIAYLGSTAPTASAFYLQATKANGSGSVAALGSSETLMLVQNLGTSVFALMGSGNVGIGTSAPNAYLSIAGNKSQTSWTTTGANFAINANTLTDTSGSGTIATRAVSSIGISTLASSSATTLTTASNLYIAGAPVAGTNTTITKALALQVAGGDTSFGGNVGIGTTTPVGKLSIEGTGAVGMQIKSTGAAAVDTINLINDMNATGNFWFAKGTTASAAPAVADKLMSLTNEGNLEVYGQQVNGATDASGVLALKTQASGSGGTKNEVSMEFYADRTNLNTMSGFIGYESNTVFDMTIMNGKNANLIFGTNNTEIMRVTPTGVEAATVTATTVSAASVNAASLAVQSSNPAWVIGGFRNTAADGYSGFQLLDNLDAIKGFMGFSNSGAAILPNSIFYSSEGAGVPLILAANKVERLRVADTGVGINGDNSTYMFYVNGTAGGTSAYVNASDRRLKKDIALIPDALDKITKLRGVTYKWNHDVHPELVLGHREEMGVIAQDVEKVFPDAVSEDKDKGIKSVAYTMLIAPLIEAVKTLNKMVTDLFSVSQKNKREIASVKSELQNKDQEIKKLQRENAEMKARLDRMEKMLMKK